MKATKIKMRSGCYNSQELTEIDSVYIEDGMRQSFWKKEELHDFLKRNPGTVEVNIFPYPDVVPATSVYGEKYVRSSPNSTTGDNLLRLPRE